jgi:phosphoserine aminotransferase
VVDGDLDAEQQAAVAKRIVVLLKEENAALDLGAYRDAPPGLRIWTGATVEKTDVEALLPWLEWAFQTAKSEIQA